MFNKARRSILCDCKLFNPLSYALNLNDAGHNQQKDRLYVEPLLELVQIVCEIPRVRLVFLVFSLNFLTRVSLDIVS